ncbi:FAD-dependent oxidoreductase [bacterium]|nr:FAD-dependent oxidoreductase [bacterium]
MSIERFVVIGGQAAGMSAASQARRKSPATRVTLLESGTDVSSLLCGLPYFLGGVVANLDDLTAVTRDAAIDNRGIDLRTDCRVVEIDRAARAVRARFGPGDMEETFPFDALCIATGARIRVPDIPGNGLPGVFALRRPGDARDIQRYIEEHRPRMAAVIGADYIGLETAENLAKIGLSVSVFESSDGVMGRIGPEVTQLIAGELERNGVKLLQGAEPQAFDGSTGVRVVRVAPSDIEADLVVMSGDLEPSTALAADAGIELGARGAIRVNERQETSEPNVFAAGDCCESLHLVTGEKVFAPSGTSANKQGRVAGVNAVGGDETFRGVLATRVVRVFGMDFGRTGLTIDEAVAAGFDAQAKTIKTYSRANYFPDGGEIFVKIVYGRNDGRLLGAQIAGPEGVKGRVDVVAAAIAGRMSVQEFSDLDLGYTPPFSAVWDPVLIASNVAKRTVKSGG